MSQSHNHFGMRILPNGDMVMTLNGHIYNGLDNDDATIDLDTIFKEIEEEMSIAKSPNLVDPNEITIPDQGFELKSDFEAYWTERGECPNCRNGQKPDILPGGGFKCEKCGWTL